MKPLSSLLILGCVLLAGCQSATSFPSKLTSRLFGPSESNHTLSRQSSSARSASVAQLSDDEFRRGEQALKRGDLKQARKSFLEVVRQQPDNAAAHHRLGYIADKMGDFTTSRIHYLTAMKLEPENPDIACDLGYSYLLQGKLTESQRYLEKALTINPSHKSSLLNMASLLGKRGDYDGALAIFRQAGSEEEAQRNIARLFPHGRPSGGMLASRDEQPSPEADEIQKKIAEMAAANVKELRERGKLKQLEPREVPAEQINDIFAQIDREFDSRKKAIPPAIPGNRATIPPSSLPESRHSENELVAQTPQQTTQPKGVPVEPASSSYSTVPGEIPVRTVPGELEDYAVLQPQTNSAVNPTTHTAQPLAQTSSPTVSVDRTTPTAQQNVAISTPGTRSPGFPAEYQNHQAAGQYAPRSRTPAEPARQAIPMQQASGGDYQQAVALAMQMGMNAGPGQMFPIASANGNLRPSSYPSGTNYSVNQPAAQPALPTQLPTRQLPPQVMQSGQPTTVPQNSVGDRPGYAPKHPHPFQHLPIQPPTTRPTPTIPTQKQMTTPYTPPVAQQEIGNSPSMTISTSPSIVTTQPGSLPTQKETEIQNWPYAPNSNLQQAAHEQTQPGQVQQAKSETPWFGQSEDQPQANPQSGKQSPSTNLQRGIENQQGNQNQLPIMQPASGSRNMPAQWPYSPQANNPPAQNGGPVIRHKTEYPGRPQYPASSPSRTQDSSPALPQVVPAAR